MKKIYTLLSAMAVASLAMAQTPQPNGFADYTGTSFTAQWYGAESGRLSVFSLSDHEKTVVQDFSSIIKDGAIDAVALQSIQPEWDVNVSAEGTADVAFVNGKDMIKLDANGDYVSLVSRQGFLKNFTLAAYLTDADGITEANSSYLKFDILLNDGSRYGMYGTTYAILYGSVEEYDFLTQFVPEGKLSTICGMKIILEKDDEHNVGNIVVKNLSYNFYEREYLLENEPVTGSSHTVEGCDPELAYFYYLSPASGDAQSDICTVDGFIAPATLEPEVLSATSYVAKWDTPHKAYGCTVRNYRVKSFAEAGDNDVMRDDFDNAKSGTVDAPKEVASLDPYTSLPGWSYATDAALIAEGMIGTKKSVTSWPPTGGYLYTPKIDLSGNGGKYTLSTRLHGTPGDVIKIYRENSVTSDYQLRFTPLTVGEDGTVDKEWTMDDGVDGRSIRMESASKGSFFIEYLYITQSVPAGTVAYNLKETQFVSSDGTAWTFDNLDENGTYAYTVQSEGYDLNGWERSSAQSDFRMVQLKESGISEVETSTAAVPFIIYDLQGRRVTAPSRGLYIVNGRKVLMK